MPASFSLVASIVPKDKMAGAAAWLTSAFQISSIIGPAMAGLIYGSCGARVAWMMPMILICVSVLWMLQQSIVPKQWRNKTQREAAISSIIAGWKFIWEKKIIFQIMMIDMFAVLFGGAVVMLPAYADQILNVGSEGLGMLRAAPAVGSIIFALFIALHPIQQIHARWLIYVAAGFGCCIIGFGLSTNFWLSMLFLFGSGAVDSVSVIVRQTLMQILTPDDMRGRVSAVSSMFIISSNEIGAFQSGTAAALFGLVPSVVLGGIGSLMVAGIAAVYSKTLRNFVLDTGKVYNK
jgi:MFS family permease